MLSLRCGSRLGRALPIMIGTTKTLLWTSRRQRLGTWESTLSHCARPARSFSTLSTFTSSPITTASWTSRLSMGGVAELMGLHLSTSSVSSLSRLKKRLTVSLRFGSSQAWRQSTAIRSPMSTATSAHLSALSTTPRCKTTNSSSSSIRKSAIST